MRERLRSRSILAVGLTGAILAAAGCGTGPGGAAAPDGAPHAAEEELPVEVVAAQGVVLRLHAEQIAVMREAPELGYLGRVERLESVARESFDIPLMARLCYGAGWEELSPEQRQTWVATFERFHVSSIADVRDRYSGQVYRMLGWSRPQPDTVVVKTVLDYPGRAVDVFVDYSVSERPQGWRIVDVHRPPAVSEVAMRRAEYRTLLERRGFDGLIEEMNARVAARQP